MTIHTRIRSLALLLGTLLLGAAGGAHAQGAAPWRDPVSTPPKTPASPVPAPPAGGKTPAPPAPGTLPAAILRVEEKTFTQEDFDRIADPYYERLKIQLGGTLEGDLLKVAKKNVVNELIRRELLIIEARRQNVTVTEAEVDEFLKRDPFFYRNGQFDPALFNQYKLDPRSNYRQVLPQVHQMAAAAKFEQTLNASLVPSPAAVRDEWSQRNEQVRFGYLPVLERDISLEPESTEQDQRAYYAAHPDQFEKKPRVHLRYLLLPLPDPADSTRRDAEKKAMDSGRDLAKSLQRGIALDSLSAPHGGTQDAGFVELPAVTVGTLGRPPELINALNAAERDSNSRVVGPLAIPQGVLVGGLSEWQPRHVAPYEEVRNDVKRRADVDVRRVRTEEEKRAWYDAHLDSLRTSRARVTRVTLSDSVSMRIKGPSKKDVESWYKANGRTLFPALAASAPVPKLNDSLRAVVTVRWTAETEVSRRREALDDIAAAWRKSGDPRSAARSEQAVVETLSFLRGTVRDSLFDSTISDSLTTDPARAGRLDGPRRFGRYQVLWRVDGQDPIFVPSYESVRPRVERAHADEKRAKEEAEAKGWYDAHRADYKTAARYVVDWVRVPVAPPDSVVITDAELRETYEKNQERYRVEEQVRARHILINSRGASAEEDGHARQRADSLLRAIRGGADFAELAKTFSQDPGSGAQGGDLGFFTHDRMVKEFADTAFAHQPGEVSELVKTRFGYHIIKVDERTHAGVRPFDEVKPELRLELARARADSLARRDAHAVRRRLVRGTEAVPVITAPYGGVQTSAPFAANEPVPALGAVPELGRDLEKLTLGKWSESVYSGSGAYAVVRLSKKLPPGPASFDEAKRQAAEDMKKAKRTEIAKARTLEVRRGLKAGASFDSLADVHGGLKDSGFLGRTSPYIPGLGPETRVVERAFKLKIGTVSDTIQASVGTVWIRPTEKKAMEGHSFEQDRMQIQNELYAKNSEEWVERKKKTIKYEILRADLREAMKPIPPRTVTYTVGG